MALGEILLPGELLRLADFSEKKDRACHQQSWPEFCRDSLAFLPMPLHVVYLQSLANQVAKTDINQYTAAVKSQPGTMRFPKRISK